MPWIRTEPLIRPVVIAGMVFGTCLSLRAAEQSVALAKVEVEGLSAEPLSEKGSWSKIPAYLEGAEVFTSSPMKQGEVIGRQLQFTVKETGLLLVAACYGVDGNPSGGWYDTRTTPKQMESQGWERVGKMNRLHNGQRNDEYVLYRRVAKAGEKHQFHTRKYVPPVVVIPSEKTIRAVLDLPSMNTISNDLASFKMPDGAIQGTNQPGLFLLRTHDSDPNERLAQGGILPRELFRQALLLTAREDLGLAVRDESLFDSFPTDPDPERLPWDAVVTVLPGNKIRATLFQLRPNGPPAVYWDSEFAMAGPSLVTGMATKCEELSRGPFPLVLRQRGFEGKPPVWKESAPTPEAIIALQERGNEIAQFEAIRRLHAEIRKSGASPERWSSLAIGYAWLGTLTRNHYSSLSKAFLARGLMYAERLVASSESSPQALCVRGYARALTGLHAMAAADFALAGEKRKENPDTSREIPVWSELLEAYRQYDRVRFQERAKDESVKMLAALLSNLEVRHSSSTSAKLRAAEHFISLVPGSFRAMDFAWASQSFSTQRAIADHGSQLLGQDFFRSVSVVEGLPDSLRKKAADWANAEMELEEIITARQEIHDALAKAGKTGTETSEPSLETLRRLSLEFALRQCVRQMTFLRRMLAVPADDTLQEIQPLVREHPLASYLEIYGSDHEAASDAMAPLVTNLDLKSAGNQELLLVADLARFNPSRFQDFWVSSYPACNRHVDEIFDDQIAMLDFLPTPQDRLPVLANLRRISPEMPATVNLQIRQDPDSVKNDLPRYLERYADDATVQLTLAEAFISFKKEDEAAKCLERLVKLAPDRRIFEMLSDIHWRKGDLEKWQSTLDGFLKLPDQGLEHARVADRMAGVLMSLGENSKAEPYAEIAADSYSEWGLRRGAELQARLGNWKKGEAYAKAISERYEGAPMEWFIWCRKWGQGDVEQAASFVTRLIDTFGEDLDDKQLTMMARFYFLRDEPTLAKDGYKAAYLLNQSRAILLLAAILDDQLGKKRERDASFTILEQQVVTPGKPPQPPSTIQKLIPILKKDLADVSRDPDLKAFDDLVLSVKEEKGTPTLLWFVMGRFLLTHGQKESAAKYLQLAATSPESFSDGCLFARHTLQKQKIVIGPWRTTEIPEPLSQPAPKKDNSERQ